ncbi:hypothetical protein ACFSC6_00035 [Rufibacter sediminis]|uniref:hypothetical protein n=1 Tax=Rufibacter sediminis TaxID=2762756 RepID=UPI00210B8B5C|nr:hypothetical protein [Rufibacter sediminis]
MARGSEEFFTIGEFIGKLKENGIRVDYQTVGTQIKQDDLDAERDTEGNYLIPASEVDRLVVAVQCTTSIQPGKI